LGYNTGPLDGIWRQRTEESVKAFQRDNGLAATGEIDQTTKAKLDFETPTSRQPLSDTGRIGTANRPTTVGPHQKVGFINLQRLVNDSEMGQTARRNLRKMRREKEALMASKLREVKELREIINKEGDNMFPRKKRDKLHR
jgi:peptidoglycan hydrolase-like protein with peptidoglycan-binding domain